MSKPDPTRELHAAIMNLPCRSPQTHVGYMSAYNEGHRDARHAAAELVSAAVPALVQPEPSGWKLVPIEPTMEMKEAAHDASRAEGPVSPESTNALPFGYELWSAAFVYRAMPAASPSASQPEGEPFTCWGLSSYCAEVGHLCRAQGRCVCAPPLAASASLTPPAREREAFELAMFKYGWREFDGYTKDGWWYYDHAGLQARWTGWQCRATAAAPVPSPEPREPLHPLTADLVDRFASALKDKLAAAEKKYGYSDGWADPGWMDECRAKLIEHVHKGDPRDVAAYCAFLWHHGARCELEDQFIYDVTGKWPTKPAAPPSLPETVTLSDEQIAAEVAKGAPASDAEKAQAIAVALMRFARYNKHAAREMAWTLIGETPNLPETVTDAQWMAEVKRLANDLAGADAGVQEDQRG